MAGLFAPQELPQGGIFGEPQVNPQGDAKLAMAAALLAGSGGGTQYRGFGEILGNALIQGQEAQRRAQALREAQQRTQIEDQYRQAQIQEMQRPQTPNSVAEYQFAAQNGFSGTYQDWMTQGSGAASPSSRIQEFNKAVETGYQGNFMDFVRDSMTPDRPSYSITQGQDGQWYKVNSRTGIPEPTGVAAPGKPVGEAQVKQDIGIKNLGLAVDEYVAALPSLSMLGYLNPAEHARIGTVYNNMMLQAKEAYNLGVLNGPDFEILQKVVTDPMTIKGAVTSKESLAKQAKELQRIMEKMRGNVNPRGVAKESSEAGIVPDNDPLGILK